MKRITLTAAATLAALCLWTTSALAVPVTMSFTARASNASGPLSGQVDLNFKIFDAYTAGTMVWEESHIALSATEGLIYADLGSVDPVTNGLDETVFTGGNMWLEITIQGAVQTPRLRINSVPYAVMAAKAADADTLQGLAPADLQLRVTGTCAVGSSIRAIAANGTVTCETDDVGSTPTLNCTTVSDTVTLTTAFGPNSSPACPAGYTMTGGGCLIGGTTSANTHLFYSYPSSTTWSCYAAGGDTSWTLSAYATCCRLQ